MFFENLNFLEVIVDKMSQGKLVSKHPSIKTLSHQKIKTTIYVKSKTPYVSALKRINKFMSQLPRHGSEYVTVMGMGKAVEKTLSLGCYFQDTKGRKVEIITKSIEVLDEVVVNDGDQEDEQNILHEEDLETTLRKRLVSGVELRIYT